MGIGNEYQHVQANTVLGFPDIARLADFNREEQHDVLQSLLRLEDLSASETSFVLGQRQTVSFVLSSGNTWLASLDDLPGSDQRKRAAYMGRADRAPSPETVANGELASYLRTDPGLSNVPFEETGSNTIQIGLRHNDYPSRATVDTQGDPEFDRWTNGLGEQVNPVTVAEGLGPGNGLRLTISSNRVVPWVAGGATRPAVCWKIDPVTASVEAVYSGSLQAGASPFIDVPHYFGQPSSSFSSNGADYIVHVQGFTTADKAFIDLSGVMDASGTVRQYVVLAEFDSSDSSTDHSMQQVVAPLQQLSQTMLDLGGLARALRAGCFIGDFVETRDWTDPANVVSSSASDPSTITFSPDPVTQDARAYIFTGHRDGRQPVLMIAPAAGPSGLVVEIPWATATGNYYVIAEISEDVTASSGRPEYRLGFILQATWDGSDDLKRRTFVLYSFTFTTGTGAITAEAAVDLTRRRGVCDGTFMGASEQADLVGRALFARDIIGDHDGFEVHLGERGDTATPYAAVHPTLQLRRLVSNEVQLSIGTPAGSVMPSGGVATIRFGDDANRIRVSEAAGDFSADFYLDSVQHTRFLATGGNAVDSTKRLVAPDFQFSGTNGKRVWQTIPLTGASGHTLPAAKNYDGGLVVVDSNLPSTNSTNAVVNQSLHSVNGYGLGQRSILHWTTHLHVSAYTSGNVQVRMLLEDANGVDKVVYDTTSFAPVLDQVAFFDYRLVIESQGSSANVRPSGMRSNPGGNAFAAQASAQPGPFLPAASDGAQLTGVDLTGSVLLLTEVEWKAAAVGTMTLLSSICTIEGANEGLWVYDPTSEEWICRRAGLGAYIAEMEFDVPLRAGLDAEIFDCEVTAELGDATGTGGTDELEMELIEAVPLTGAETQLATVLITTTSKTPRSLKPASPVAIDVDRRYFLRATATARSTDGTRPDFKIHAARIQTELHELM